MLADEVTIVRPTTGARNLYGGSTGYSVIGTYPARYVQKATRVRAQTGDRITSEGVAWVKSSIALSTSYMAKVGDQVVAIQAVENFGDEDGHHHSKLMFGWRESRGGR